MPFLRIWNLALDIRRSNNKLCARAHLIAYEPVDRFVLSCSLRLFSDYPCACSCTVVPFSYILDIIWLARHTVHVEGESSMATTSCPAFVHVIFVLTLPCVQVTFRNQSVYHTEASIAKAVPAGGLSIQNHISTASVATAVILLPSHFRRATLVCIVFGTATPRFLPSTGN